MENATHGARILALSDGKPGHFHQTEGILAHLPEFEQSIHRVEFASKRADNALRAKVAVGRGLIAKRAARSLIRSALSPASAEGILDGGPFDVVLSTGSSVAAPNLLAARIHGAKSVVCTRPSPIGIRPFDLAILPFHQWRFATSESVRVLGVPTHITPESLAAHYAALRAEAEHAGQSLDPTIGLLFGGNDRRYRWPVELAQKVIEVFTAVAAQTGLRLAIATSRRTPKDVERFIRARLRESPVCAYAAFAHDPPSDPFPVQTILARSVWVGVTVDSFSMVCEAASSGKPVALIEIPPRRRDRFAPAYDAMAQTPRLIRMRLDTMYDMALSLTHSPPDAKPLRDAQVAANGIRALMGMAPS